ncbi:hypothetical protein [Mycobacteroides abscessus]|uniref:hypothetical protein n=1 Tax=Mycobacteroides abscessus TaxID=36809 RepID=UPI0009CFB9C9|nr:hypothetical protein [Mycobacteroides abscessus]SKK29163.1 Uncharacterised protein [Mycobacteroides abscessus subsp. abscessus]
MASQDNQRRLRAVQIGLLVTPAVWFALTVALVTVSPEAGLSRHAEDLFPWVIGLSYGTWFVLSAGPLALEKWSRHRNQRLALAAVTSGEIPASVRVVTGKLPGFRTADAHVYNSVRGLLASKSAFSIARAEHKALRWCDRHLDLQKVTVTAEQLPELAVDDDGKIL